MVLGRDGFAIEGMTNGTQMNIQAVGAVISTGIGSAEVMGKNLEVGAMTQGMVEYKDGIIVMSFLAKDAILAVVAGLNANLGNVRYQVKKDHRKSRRTVVETSRGSAIQSLSSLVSQRRPFPTAYARLGLYG